MSSSSCLRLILGCLPFLLLMDSVQGGCYGLLSSPLVTEHGCSVMPPSLICICSIVQSPALVGLLSFYYPATLDGSVENIRFILLTSTSVVSLFGWVARAVALTCNTVKPCAVVRHCCIINPSTADQFLAVFSQNHVIPETMCNDTEEHDLTPPAWLPGFYEISIKLGKNILQCTDKSIILPSPSCHSNNH